MRGRGSTLRKRCIGPWGFCCIPLLPIWSSVPFRQASVPPSERPEFVCLPLEGSPTEHGASYLSLGFSDFGFALC